MLCKTAIGPMPSWHLCLRVARSRRAGMCSVPCWQVQGRSRSWHLHRLRDWDVFDGGRCDLEGHVHEMLLDLVLQDGRWKRHLSLQQRVHGARPWAMLTVRCRQIQECPGEWLLYGVWGACLISSRQHRADQLRVQCRLGGARRRAMHSVCIWVVQGRCGGLHVYVVPG